MHYSTVLRIIRAGLEGDKETIISYTKLLADKAEADGDTNTAERLRKYAAGNFGAIIHAAESNIMITAKEAKQLSENAVKTTDYNLPHYV